MQADVYLNNPNTRDRINPATEESQVKVKDELAGSIIKNSSVGGNAVLTITANVAGGSDVGVRSVLLYTDAADVTMTIGESAADADDFLLLQNSYTPVPVSNLKFLQFYGATNGAKIYILYRG
jgi:hypothetical protein